MLLLIGTPEAMEKREELWQELRNADPQTYQELRYRFLGRAANAKSAVGRAGTLMIYRIANRIFGFN